MTKKKRERKALRRQERPPTKPGPSRGTPGTLGEARPEIEALERATGNKARVREMSDGKIMLDFSTPRVSDPKQPGEIIMTSDT